jgi:hypothetical protein
MARRIISSDYMHEFIIAHPQGMPKGAPRCIRHRAQKPAWVILVAVAVVFALSSPAFGQEFYTHGGIIEASHDDSYSWQLSYLEGLGEHFAYSVSWLNEGHLTDHHRDGPLLQFWVRKNIYDRRLSLAAGIGPYLSFDTQYNETYRYKDIHNDVGGVGSLSVTWYMENRWLLKSGPEGQRIMRLPSFSGGRASPMTAPINQWRPGSSTDVASCIISSGPLDGCMRETWICSAAVALRPNSGRRVPFLIIDCLSVLVWGCTSLSTPVHPEDRERTNVTRYWESLHPPSAIGSAVRTWSVSHGIVP